MDSRRVSVRRMGHSRMEPDVRHESRPQRWRRVLPGLVPAIAAFVCLSTSSHPAVANPSAQPSEVEELKTAARVSELCLAARPEDRVVFAEDEGSAGVEREAFRQKRRKVMRQLYRVRVPSQGFNLLPFRRQGGELLLEPGQPLRTLHGAVALSVPSDDSGGFVVTPQLAEVVAALAKQNELDLDYYFLLSDDLGSPCQGSVATQVFSLSTTPVAFMLTGPNGEVFVRDETALADAHRESLGGFTGVPAVFVGPVTTERGVDPERVAQRLEVIREPLKSCYEDRIADRPGVAGMVVLGVGVGAGGNVQTLDVLADALMDETLLECVDKEIRRVRFAGLQGLPTLFRVPVELRRVSPRTGAGR